MASPDVGLEIGPGQDVELCVVDLSLARAFHEGLPAARLLARVQLASDERDLELRTAAERSTFDATLARMLSGARPALERVRKAVARQMRAASDEGPLPANEGTLAALVFSVALGPDADASLFEVGGEAAPLSRGQDEGGLASSVRQALARWDRRLAPDADARVPLFEACVRLATTESCGPWTAARLDGASRALYRSELGMQLLVPSPEPLLPRDIDAEAARAVRRIARLERQHLDTLLARDPRELAKALARSASLPDDALPVDRLLADVTRLLRHAGTLVLAIPLEPVDEDELGAPPPSARASWAPGDWEAPDAALRVAQAIEQGTLTTARLAALVERGGDGALDAIGAEMLRVELHPFASSAFADVLSRSPRPRDVMRLVTFFAVAPDPSQAARALASSAAPDVPTVLKAWLEAMLPLDGAPPPEGSDPETSSAARVRACVSALRPYPALFSAVSPLLDRVSEAPRP
jgi:hypothetical protein